MNKLLLKIIIVIACVVGFAFGGAFIGLVAYDLHLTGRHYGGFLGGVEEALWGLCIGAIIGGVASYKIIKAKTPRASIRIIITLLFFCIGCGVIWAVGIEVKQRIDESNDIFLATKNGNIGAVRQHLASGVDVYAKGNRGDTPLHEVARWGHKEIAELIITAGADVNAKTNYGYTPLHTASDAGYKEIAELLIAKGADVNAKDNRGRTPLDSAIKDKHTEIAALLRKHGGKTGKELKAEAK